MDMWELKISLLAEKRVYDDNPSVNANHKDLSRLIEVIIQIIDEKIIVKGFENK